MQDRYEELKWNDKPLYNRFDPGDEDEMNNKGKGKLIQQRDNNEIQRKEVDDVRQFIPMQAETTALLVVDVQPEYWSNCPAVRKDFPNFPSNLERTVNICRQRKAKIIWVRADYRRSHSPWLVQFERIHQGKIQTNIPCDPSSDDLQWEDFATPQGGEVIITKTSWSSTSNTALIDFLRSAGIETVLVCGLITSVCVQHSAFGVFEAGYRTLLVTDSCADRGKARHDAALALYGDYMYELVTGEDLRSTRKGLIPAQPVWLKMDKISRNIVRSVPVNVPIKSGNDSNEEEKSMKEKFKSNIITVRKRNHDEMFKEASAVEKISRFRYKEEKKFEKYDCSSKSQTFTHVQKKLRDDSFIQDTPSPSVYCKS